MLNLFCFIFFGGKDIHYTGATIYFFFIFFFVTGKMFILVKQPPSETPN